MKYKNKKVRVSFMYDEKEGLYSFFTDDIGGAMVVIEDFEKGKEETTRAISSSYSLKNLQNYNTWVEQGVFEEEFFLLKPVITFDEKVTDIFGKHGIINILGHKCTIIQDIYTGTYNVSMLERGGGIAIADSLEEAVIKMRDAMECALAVAKLYNFHKNRTLTIDKKK